MSFNIKWKIQYKQKIKVENLLYLGKNSIIFRKKKRENEKA